MRRIALPRLKQGQRGPMLMLSAISLACWSYGAFLGVARGLAYGMLPYLTLLTGFLLAIAACIALTYLLEAQGRAVARA